LCPEVTLADAHTALGTGYGESKYVAEQVGNNHTVVNFC
jgi:hypothetical protein